MAGLQMCLIRGKLRRLIGGGEGLGMEIEKGIRIGGIDGVGAHALSA